MTTLNIPIRLRRGLQAACPATLLSGELYVCEDTGLLFAGNSSGTGVIQVGGGNAPVASVFGRTGAIVAESSDYSSDYDTLGAAATAQTNAENFATSAVATETARAEAAEALLAPLASPSLTGNPKAPTQTALDDSTKIATTAYVDSAVAVESSRAETAEALKAPKASPALTGNPTAPTPSTSDNSTKIATTAYVQAQGYLASPLTLSELPANPSTPSGAGFFGGFRIGNIPPQGLNSTRAIYVSGPGDLCAMLIYIDQQITITHITVSVTAANGTATTFDAGLYTVGGSLVANTAGFNGNSATVQRLACAQGSVTLIPGWYYMAVCSEGSATTTMKVDGFTQNGSDGNSWLMMNGGSTVVFGYKAQASGNSWNSTGILPSTLPTLATGSFTPTAVYFSA